ncbi:MAG: dihydrofolate reductase [Lachnospiraceae bacterium]|nr:dihydrofolate reductase [Lachnospiraceae bacterium]
MNMIVIADNNYAISYKGKPLVSIPAEKKSRMEEISGKVIVYSKNYIEELPGKQPLVQCKNLIFTDKTKCDIKPSQNVSLFDDLASLRKELSNYDTKDIYILDNEKLYKEFLDDTDVIHLTKVDYEYEADAFFENLDENEDFQITADSDELYCFNIIYSFLKYERKK